MKKNPFSLHLNLDSFIPATDAEKEYMVKMRPSSTFFKDGVKRLLKNPVATVAFFLIVIITLSCIIIPMFWPYAYDQMLGNTPGQPMDGSYKNLSPFDYGSTERMKLLGTANAQVFTFPVEAKNEKMLNAQKKDAEKLLEAYRAGAMTSESFAALESTLDDKGDVYVRHDAVKPSVFGSKEATVEQWLWEVDWLGDSVRVAGDVELIKSETGFHVVRFESYEGETTSIIPHIFGTDNQGRDYFIRVVYGTRISLIVGFFASIIVLIIGLTIGSIAGYFGGKVDLIIMRIVDIIYSLPDMLMVILLASVMATIGLDDWIEGTFLEKIGSNIISLFIVFGLFYWVSMSRLVRGQILSLREQEYVLAARAAGAKSGWVIRKHLIPNSISVVIISTALQIPNAIFTESYLSFLGLGVNAPMPSLGSLASDALNGIYSYAYQLIIPAAVISLIVLSLNLFGDGLRDAFDPKINT